MNILYFYNVRNLLPVWALCIEILRHVIFLLERESHSRSRTLEWHAMWAQVQTNVYVKTTRGRLLKWMAIESLWIESLPLLQMFLMVYIVGDWHSWYVYTTAIDACPLAISYLQLSNRANDVLIPKLKQVLVGLSRTSIKSVYDNQSTWHQPP